MFFVLTSTSLFPHPFVHQPLVSATLAGPWFQAQGGEENGLKQRGRAWLGAILPTVPVLERGSGSDLGK